MPRAWRNFARSASAGSRLASTAARLATSGRRANQTCSRFGAGNGVIGVRSRTLSTPISAIGSHSSISRRPRPSPACPLSAIPTPSSPGRRRTPTPDRKRSPNPKRVLDFLHMLLRADLPLFDNSPTPLPSPPRSAPRPPPRSSRDKTNPSPVAKTNPLAPGRLPGPCLPDKTNPTSSWAIPASLAARPLPCFLTTKRTRRHSGSSRQALTTHPAPQVAVRNEPDDTLGFPGKFYRLALLLPSPYETNPGPPPSAPTKRTRAPGRRLRRRTKRTHLPNWQPPQATPDPSSASRSSQEVASRSRSSNRSRRSRSSIASIRRFTSSDGS